MISHEGYCHGGLAEIWDLPDGVIPVNHRFAEIWEIREILRVSGQEIAIFREIS